MDEKFDVKKFQKEIYEQAKKDGWLDELKESLTLRYCDDVDNNYGDEVEPDAFCSKGPVNAPIIIKTKRLKNEHKQ